jgi:CubicO group peptidase (beta-lactamase class C family)
VEIVSGKPYDVFLKERIFVPLGMNDTGFSVPPEKKARMLPLIFGDSL